MTTNRSFEGIGRRKFLAGSAAATFTILRPELVRGTTANSAIDIGIIGTGGRGGWIANLFARSGKYNVVAVADYFADRVNPVGDKLEIPADKRFTTLSGYKRLLEQKLDAVAIETPPYFHPEQAAAAVDAGKHVYLSKPIAVDVPGCMTITEAGKQATAKNLVYLIDFQTRSTDLYIDAVNRVHRGTIGPIVSVESNYLWSGLVHPDKATDPEMRLRYWYQSLPLCGDCIVEQDIHALDVATWILDAAPLKAVGHGGRKIRENGETWDHFQLVYTFPNDLLTSFVSQKGVPGITDEIRVRAYGAEGMIDTDYGGLVTISGNNPFKGGITENIYEAGTVRNIETFYNAVTGGDVSNPTIAPSVRSNLTAILGREAAYTGKEVAWDEMISKGEELKADLTGLKS